MILKLSASGWFLFSFIIDDARSHEREVYYKALCMSESFRFLLKFLDFMPIKAKIFGT
jgi:hypothetical protein